MLLLNLPLTDGGSVDINVQRVAWVKAVEGKPSQTLVSLTGGAENFRIQRSKSEVLEALRTFKGDKC
jgi:hypothetical protein